MGSISKEQIKRKEEEEDPPLLPTDKEQRIRQWLEQKGEDIRLPPLPRGKANDVDW